MAADPSEFRKAVHEAGHAVVGIAVGLEALRLFMNPISGTTRGAGVDFVPVLDGTFRLDTPLETRRPICLRLIAEFAAGFLAEQMFVGDIYEPWTDGPDGDRANILNKAVWGIATADDQPVIVGEAPYEDWPKCANVEALIAEGETLAASLLDQLSSAVLTIAEIAQRVKRVSGRNLHLIVEREMAVRGIVKV